MSTRPPHIQRAQRPTKQVLTAWLLLLVDDGVRHGYELGRELDALWLTIDQGVLYRALRQFETAGALRSQWVRGATGPQRRCYELTAAGVRALEDSAGEIVAMRKLHDEFLHAHEARLAHHRSRGGGDSSLGGDPTQRTGLREQHSG